MSTATTTDELDAKALASLIGNLLQGLERGTRQWTLARRKDSLQRLLRASRGAAEPMRQKLERLVASWDTDAADAAVQALDSEPAALAPAVSAPPSQAEESLDAAHGTAPQPSLWPGVAGALSQTVRHALADEGARARELGDELSAVQALIAERGLMPEQAARVVALCDRARRLLHHRQHLYEQTRALCGELATSLVALAEDESWAQGQCEAMRVRLAEGLNARGVRAVNALLSDTRQRHQEVRAERARARDALKSLIQRMLAEVGELGQHTGRFSDNVGRYAEVIAGADSLESLADTVREMVEESRTVSVLVAQTQTRLSDEHAKAAALANRVQELEGELRRLSDEVFTDPLTGVANRRGLAQAFEAEQARAQRGDSVLSVGLLDIDDFKRLNDSLGHAAGDQALVALAQRVQQSLRPMDQVARYGGEEFVVLLPQTPAAEAQQVLARLQRSLSASLFLHDEQPVFVTFSAGVSEYRDGERIEEVLERADEALYEAKRTGKNRTCVG